MKTYTAFAKVNIFLKITGHTGTHHTLASRFMRVHSLFDTLYFEPKEQQRFIIDGDFDCDIEQNSIYKAYLALQRHLKSDALHRLIQRYKVVVEKRIPSFAGLGGGSSDAATFMKMCNEVLHLGLSKHELATIALEVGADVPFFIYDYESANVSGIGDIVEPFHEAPLDILTITPPIHVSTPAVYKQYKAKHFQPINLQEAQQWLSRDSAAIFEHFSIDEANDLFTPALELYPTLKNSYQHGYLFSGSGASFFTRQ